MEQLAIRTHAGRSLAGLGILVLAFSVVMLFAGAGAAYALDDPTNTDKELLCHSLGGSNFSELSVDKSSVETAHPEAGHSFDIIEGRYSETLGRVAVGDDIATIIVTPTTLPNGQNGVEYTIEYLCGDSTATTTSTTLAATTTTSTLATTTTAIGGPCDPNDPDCLPNTGAGSLAWILGTGLGLLLLGAGILMIPGKRQPTQVA